MAAYTSNGTGGGNFNAVATWTNGVTTPFQLLATDTFTVVVGDTVTITADNLIAGTGAGTVNGTLICSFNETQNFCGALTVASGGVFSTPLDGNQKTQQQGDGTITVNLGGTINLAAKTTITFNNAAQGGKGLVLDSGCVFSLVGTSSASKDVIIQGTSTKEAFVKITGAAGTVFVTNTISNVLINKCHRVDATNIGALALLGCNRGYNGMVTFGDIDITNTSGNYDVYLTTSNIPSTAGTITTSNTGATTGSVDMVNTVDHGNWNITRSAGNTILTNNVKLCGLYTITMTGTAQLVTTTSNHNGATFNITTSSSGTGLGLQNGNSINSTYNITSTSSSGTRILLRGWYTKNDTMVVDGGSGTSGSIVCDYGVNWDGSTATVKNQSAGSAFNIGEGQPNVNFISGKWDCQSSCACTGLTLVSSGQSGTGQDLKHTGVMQFLLDTSGTAVSFTTNAQNIEPFIYVSSSASKRLAIYWICQPSNQSDWTTTGSVSFFTTAGAIVVTGAGTVTTSKCQPWQVTTWGTFTPSVSGGSGISYDYRVSYDGGSTWGGWTAITSGNAPAVTPIGNGLDAIQIRVTNTSGTLTISNLQILTNSFADATFALISNYLIKNGRKIKSIATNRWVEI